LDISHPLRSIVRVGRHLPRSWATISINANLPSSPRTLENP
jgi:hypothetical protein